MKQAIGIIDSGFGGMSVVKALLAVEPAVDFIYLGDQARCPYGDRTTEELLQFTLEMITYLVEQHAIKAVVIACNTISANCLPAVRAHFSIPIISIVECGVRLALQRQLHPLAVIATSKTIGSKMYQEQLASLAVEALATPTFAMAVETQAYTQAAITQALAPLQTKSLQAILLGCTHYPFLATEIQHALPQCELLDPAAAVFCEVAPFITTTNNQQIFTTGSVEQFANLLAKLMPDVTVPITQLDLQAEM